jgi:PAS domain S-box-containing protein
MFIRTTALTLIELRTAIVREPLVVSPDTTVMDAICQMSGVRSLCNTTRTADSQQDDLHLEARSSCVLVVENEQLVGVLTERDVVRLSARQRCLENLVLREVMTHPVVTLRESGFTDLFLAINLLQQHNIRHLPILDEFDRLVGLVTHESLRQISRPLDLLRLRIVAEVMTREVICTAPDSSLLAIVQLMAEHRVSSVMIVHPGGISTEPLQMPVGIVTERDIVQFQALGLKLETCRAEAVMSTPIFKVKPEESLLTVQQIMEQRSIRRLAVTGEQGELLGIVTQTSLLQALNPLELYKLAEVLEQKVVRLEAEKVALLENRTVELEQQVAERTLILKAKAHREQLLNTIAEQIRSSLNISDILDTTVQEIRSLLECDRVIIYEFRPDFSGTVIAEAITDIGRSVLHSEAHDPCISPEWLEPYRQGRIRIVNDIYGEAMTLCHQEMLVGFDIRAKLMVPIVIEEQLWGLMLTSYRERPHLWTTDEIELLRQVSLQVAIALGQATIHQKLQKELIKRQRIEATLIESEERYAALTAAAPVGIFRTDAEGLCTYVNDRHFQISGLTPGATIGDAWQQRLHPDDRDWVIAQWEQFMQGNDSFELEYRFQRPDGEVTWVYGQCVPELDANGHRIGSIGTITDISDRKRTEAFLQESEERYATLVEVAPVGIFRTDPGGNCIYANERWCQISGLTPKTAIGEGWRRGLYPEDRDSIALEWQQSTQQNRPFRLEYRFQRPDGAVAWVYGQSVAELDADGQVVGYVGAITDISDRKLAETALIQSEAQSRAILAAVPDFMFRIGADGIYRGSVTPNRQHHFLGTGFDTPGVAMVDIMSGEIATRHLHHLEQALGTGELQVYEQQVHIGPRLQYEEVRVVKSGEDEALFMIRDVTDRKQAERQLYQLNQQLEAKVEERTQELWQVNSLQRAILDGADYSIISTDLTGLIQTFNAGAERMLGYSAAEVVGKGTPELFHEANEVIDRAASLSAELRQNIAPGFEVFVAASRQGLVSEEEWSYVRKDGSRFPVSLSISTLKDVNQQIIGFLGIAKDISDRKRAEAELQKVSDRLALALKSGALGCWDFDLVQNTVLWDERMYELYGVTKQSDSLVVYDIWANRLHPEDRTATETFLQQAVLGQVEFDTEFRVLHPDGSLHFIKAYGIVVPDAQGNPQSMIGLNFDISDRKQAELERQQLIQELSVFKQALDQSAIVVITDAIGVISYVNDRFCALSGYSRDELMGETHRLVNSGYHPPRFFQDLWQTIASGHVWRGEICNQAKNGSLYWVASTIVPFLDEGGQPFQYLAIRFDITDRKLAQATLQQENTFRQQIVENMTEGLCVFYEVDEFPFLCFTVWNQQMQAITGYTLEEINRLGWHHSLYPNLEDREHSIATCKQMHPIAVEREIQRQDGQRRTVSISTSILSIDDEHLYVLSLIQDITERQQTERENRLLKERLEFLLASSPAMIYSCKPYGDYGATFMSKNIEVILGYKPEDFLSESGFWANHIHPEDAPRVFAHLSALFEHNTHQHEYRFLHGDGHYVWLRDELRLLRDEQGKPTEIVGYFADISDVKQTEETLKLQLAAIEAAIDGIAIMQADTYLYVNQAHLKMFGYESPQELVGKTWKSLYSPEELERFEGEVFPVLGRDRAWEGEAIATRKDGSTFAEGLSLTLTEDGLLICVCRDISDRKQAQKALQESQQFLETVLDTIPLAVFWKNRESVFLGCNQQFAKTLGLPSTTESIGKTDLDIYHAEVEANGYCAMDRRLVETGEAILGIEETLTLPNGKPIFIETHKAPLRDFSGNIIGLVGTFQDITDRKEAEARLQQQAKQERLLGAITKRMRSSLHLDEILNSTVEEIHQLLQSDRTLVYRVDPEGTGTAIAESVSPNTSKLLDILFPEEVFPQENYDRYVQGRVFALNDREYENESILPCLVEFLAEIQVRAKLVVPIIQNQTLWGLLIVHQCDRPRQWQDWEINLLKQIANQLEIAIQQSYLYEQVQSELAIRKQTEKAIALQLQRQRTLGEIAQQIRESLDIKQILATVTQQVKEILQGDRIIVIRLFGNGRSQIVEESVLTEFAALKNLHWDDQLWSQEILNHYCQGKPRIVPDIMTDMGTNCLVEYASVGEVKSKMVAPILQEVRSSESHRGVTPGQTNKLWGVLVVHACREKRVWQESEVQLLQQIANQLAIAVQQASLFEQLQQQLTERQQAQQQLTERNQQLGASNEELARATRLKDEFLANMSHELRTPLNAILGMTEGLQDQVFGIVNEKQIKALQTIERSGSHLLELINDILDVAKIESGQIELDCTPVSINHLCQSSLPFIKQQALQKRIQLEIKVPLNLPDLLIDERRMRQVLINLLNNAVKFTPNGGRITLEVSSQQRRADPDSADSPPHFLLKETLQIAVIDTGIGIASEHINKLFQPFIQIDGALNRQYQGTGLGLALVKRIVELHGGQVGLTSEVGVGSCFTIEFEGRHGGIEFEGRHGGIEFEGRHGGTAPTGAPSSVALESQTEPRIEPSEPEQQGGSPLILLAEDNEANISTVSSYLKAKGYRILLAKNGEEAIALAKSENPNLILMDIQMPGMDGLEAMQQIRLDPNLVDLPIIALTALAMTGDRDRCLAAGANDYLTKPVKLKQLAATIQHLLTSLVR